MTVETCLYRAYDDGGLLLYVGISLRVLNRLQKHRQSSPWFCSLAHLTVSRYPSRDLALSAERSAIMCEKPKFNRMWNSPNTAHRYADGESFPVPKTRHQIRLETFNPPPIARRKKSSSPDIGAARSALKARGLNPDLFTDDECLRLEMAS